MSIHVFRSGKTSPYWSSDPYAAMLGISDNMLKIEFEMPSKGGGVTEVSVRVSPESFEDAAKLMLLADDDAAIHAFGVALAERNQRLTELQALRERVMNHADKTLE